VQSLLVWGRVSDPAVERSSAALTHRSLSRQPKAGGLCFCCPGKTGNNGKTGKTGKTGKGTASAVP